MTLEEAKDAYIVAIKRQHYSRHTIYSRDLALKRFLAFLESRSVRFTQDITKGLIFEYLGKFRDKHPLTARGEHVMLRSFFSKLHAEEHLTVDYSGVIPIPKCEYKVSRKVLTEAEIRKFLSIPNVKTPKGLRDRAILEVLYSSALRGSELVGLDLYDVNETEGTLWVRQGKGKKDRIVPVGRVAMKWLKKYLDEMRKYYAASYEQALFVSLSRGERLAPKSVAEIIRDYAREAQLTKRVATHAFRHTCATHMLKNGADIRYVQEMLGHTSAHTTEIYTHLDITDLKPVITRCHPRSKLGT
jgi:integrase/recombinase XerD